MTNLTKLIAEIDGLASKATPGPLVLANGSYMYAECLFIKSKADPNNFVRIGKIYGRSKESANAETAEKIISLYNNWPVLRAACAVVEAARRVSESSCEPYVGEWQLEAALSALDAELGKGEV